MPVTRSPGPWGHDWQGTSSSSCLHDDDGEDVAEGMSRSKPVIIVDSGFSTTVQSPEPESLPPLPTVAAVGSALKRNADGTVVAPKISKRKPKEAKVSPYTE